MVVAIVPPCRFLVAATVTPGDPGVHREAPPIFGHLSGPTGARRVTAAPLRRRSPGPATRAGRRRGRRGGDRQDVARRAVCGELRRRVLWGACDPLITPRPLGPLRDVARQAGGAIAAASTARARPCSARRSTALAAARRAGRSRTSTGPTTARSTWSPCSGGGSCGPRLPPPHLPQRGVAERPEVRRVLAALPRECVRRIEPEPLSRTPSRCSPAARGASRPTSTRSRAATRSTSPRCSPRPPTAACRRASATRSRCA